jgi:soluble P-type ATPase
MKRFEIPGCKPLDIEHLVLDYNGTIAVDGVLLPHVGEILDTLGKDLLVHIITADTFGMAQEQLRGINCTLVVLSPGTQDILKLDYIQKLGADKTICIGNGRNDVLMIKEAAIGIAVVLEEGACAQTMIHSDIVCKSIIDALTLLTNPARLAATLRNN